mmetsp:Transcript_1392/g.2923  ORF Transcript_1392/g.2923 Transcript_1392/m.2923 type:complete len:269 (+) Transcript_1392:205-1011(+)
MRSIPQLLLLVAVLSFSAASASDEDEDVNGGNHLRRMQRRLAKLNLASMDRAKATLLGSASSGTGNEDESTTSSPAPTVTPSSNTTTSSPAPSASASPTESPTTPEPTTATPTTTAPTTPAPTTPAPTTPAPTTPAPTTAPPTTAPPTTASPTTASPTTAPPTTIPPTTAAPTQAPHHPRREWWIKVLWLLFKTACWMVLAVVFFFAFGAIMSNRYRIYYYLRGTWFTFYHRLRRGYGSSDQSAPSSMLNDIIFSDNEMHEGLLMRET